MGVLELLVVHRICFASNLAKSDFLRGVGVVWGGRALMTNFENHPIVLLFQLGMAAYY